MMSKIITGWLGGMAIKLHAACRGEPVLLQHVRYRPRRYDKPISVSPGDYRDTSQVSEIHEPLATLQ